MVENFLDVYIVNENLVFPAHWEITEVGLNQISGAVSFDSYRDLVVAKFGERVWDEHVSKTKEGRDWLGQKPHLLESQRLEMLEDA